MTDFERIQNEIETNEGWLRGLGEPVVPVGLAGRIKGAVQIEISRLTHDSSRVRTLARWHGALAAAAVLVLCTTVVWKGAAVERARVDRIRLAEKLADSLNVVDAADVSLSVLGEEIDAVCSSSKSELDYSIDDLGDSIESASSDPISSL